MTASNISGLASPDPATGFVPSASVTVTATASAALGWNATASHAGTVKDCYIFIGTTPGALGTATVEGEPRCDP